MIVATAGDRAQLGQDLAAQLDAEHVEIGTKRFPDGERYARIEADLEGPVVVAADLRPNEEVVGALIACDAAREAGAGHVTLAVPYLAYARQDRSFEHGEAVSSRAINRALSANADALATVDPHMPDVLDFFDGPAAGASAAPEIADALDDRGVELVLAPDEGARERAEGVADQLGCDVDHLEKTRKSAREVVIQPADRDVSGKTVAVVDDIVATGGTMATATGQLYDAGAESVLLAATHGVFADGALKRLEDAGADAILATDAIESSASTISVAPALARAVQQVRSG